MHAVSWIRAIARQTRHASAHVEGQLADAGNGGGERGGWALAACVWQAKVLGLCHHCCVSQRHMHLLMHMCALATVREALTLFVLCLVMLGSDLRALLGMQADDTSMSIC